MPSGSALYVASFRPRALSRCDWTQASLMPRVLDDAAAIGTVENLQDENEQGSCWANFDWLDTYLRRFCSSWQRKNNDWRARPKFHRPEKLCARLATRRPNLHDSTASARVHGRPPHTRRARSAALPQCHACCPSRCRCTAARGTPISACIAAGVMTKYHRRRVMFAQTRSISRFFKKGSTDETEAQKPVVEKPSENKVFLQGGKNR